MVVSTVAEGGVSGGRSGAVERLSSSGEIERGASPLGDLVGAASAPETKTSRLREPVATAVFQQARLHAD